MSVTVFGELTADEQTIILMATGPDHEVARAAAALQTLTPLFKATEPPGALQLPATWAAVVQLSATFAGAWRPGPALSAWITAQLVARTGQHGDLTVPPPAGLTPRPYQVAGARLIGMVGSGLLFDDQGTGKTITTILGLRERHGAGHPVLPVVIVCPNAVVDSWVEHVHRWAPGWRAVAWRGTPKRRLRLAGTADVYVTSYGTARMDAGTGDAREIARGKAPLLTLGASMVIADEVHKIKSAATSQSRAVQRIAARAVGFVGLSGTPITHSPKDLWAALYCLSPGAWPSSERWVHRYCDTIPGDYADTVIGLRPQSEPEFRDTLLGQYRRVSKADVLADLPPKVYSVRHVDLPKDYRDAYDTLEKDMLAELPDGGQLEAMTVLAQLTRLLQLASAAADVKTWTEIVEDPTTGLEMEKTHQEVTLRYPSWKVDELLEIMDERPGQQIAAYAPSRQLMMLAGQAATAAGYRVGYVVGGQTAKERTANVEAFQRGELDLICVTTGAGGVGITLTAAGTAVFLQRPWSLVEALQAEDRQHRIGSERHSSVEIVDIVATKTIETRVRSILKERAGQLSDLVQDRRIVEELLGGAETRDLRKKAAA